MAEEVSRQQDKTPDVPENPSNGTDPALAREQWEDMPRPETTANQAAPETLTFDNAFQRNASDSLNHFVDMLGLRGDRTAVNPEKCAACTLPKEQLGLISPVIASDIRPEHGKKPEVTLKELPDGRLERVAVTMNTDGSQLSVTTREEYVRDANGAIKKDAKGRDMTRVLEEDKEAKDKAGKTVFRSHKENQYDERGNLTESRTDNSNIGKDGKLSKFNSFLVRNEYDAFGRLTGQNSAVLDVNGKPVQQTEAKYGYDEHGNRTSEDITRERGLNGEKTREHRDHTFKQFGDRYEKVGTKTQLFDKKGEEDGNLETTYDRDKKGTLTGEHTKEFDKQQRATHVFDAYYDAEGYRLWSKDTHTSYHANGAEHMTTTSEFSAFGDSTAVRVEKDEQGEVVSKRGFVQKEDGSFVDYKKPDKTLLSAESGQALGGYWDKEDAWAQLERLSGDATNRDVVAGFDQLGKFAAGHNNHAAAVEKLEKWGGGDATHGVTILEQNWGNGDGRAAQGMDTYLSMGSSAVMKKAGDKGAEGVTEVATGMLKMFAHGIDSKDAWAHLQKSVEKFGEAIDALEKKADEAEKFRVRIHEKADVSGDLLTALGNGECKDGVCSLKKDGDEGKPEVPGEPDAFERGLNGHLRWSLTGDNFGEALRNRADMAGGDMVKLGQMTELMGTTEVYENGEVKTVVSRMAGNDNMLALGVTPEGTIDPRQAVEQYKRSGITPEGYDGLVGARNYFEGGIQTAMTIDAQGRRVPVLDANGNPIYLRSAERGVEAVVTIGGGNPVHGMDAMQELSTKRNANGEVVSVDMRVGFGQLPKIGETLVVAENGTIVPVRDSMVSAQTILNYGAPARDAQGNPIPVRDAQGNVVPQGVVGAQALVEVTRTKDGTDGAQIYNVLQAATVNERAIFAKAVAEGRVEPGATFSAAENTRESLQFIGRTGEQTSGSALEGARLITREQTAADGRTFTVSPDGSVVGGLNAIRQADSSPAGEKTVMGGAREISLFAPRSEQTFIEGARLTAAMADRNDASTGRPMEATQLFTNGISNVQAYAKDGTFASGRETVAFIGGGAENPNAIPQGVREIRTAADTTTGGSVSQMAAVTATAGGGDPRVGAEALMNYRGREGGATNPDGTPARSYSEGAKALYTDLYGAPNAQHNVTAGQTLQPRDVERAMNLATPGTPVVQQLQSGMDKTNEIVRSSGNPELTGAHVLSNLASNPVALETVKAAPNPVAAREALQADPAIYRQMITPVVATTTNNAVAKEAAVTAPIAIASATTAMTANAAVHTAESRIAEARIADAKMVETKIAEAKADAKAAAEATATAVRNLQAAAAAAVAAQAAAHKAEVAPVVNIARNFGTDSSALLKANFAAIGAATKSNSVTDGSALKTNSGAQAVQSLQSIVASGKVAAATGSDATVRSGSCAMTITTSAAAKNVVNTDATTSRTLAAHGNVNLNHASAGSAHQHFLKASVSTNSSTISDVIRTARQGDISSAKTSTSTNFSQFADGRVQPLRSGAVSNPTSPSTNNRSMDLMIARTFRGFGGTTSTDPTELRIARNRIKRMRRLGEGDRALLGAEIALVALLVSASIAKEKSGKTEAKKAKLGGAGAELAKASDAAGDISEIDNDDNANKRGLYHVLTRPTWLVRPGEDLVKLAEHLFHEAELGWLIADLNVGQIKESFIDGKRVVELKVRQRIDLPVWQDIVEFHKSQAKNARPENLITIVAENAVDTELLNTNLALAMGATVAARPAAAAPLPQPALVIAGAAPSAKEAHKAALFASAKRAIAVRRAATTVSQKDQDQGPTAGAVATTGELQPKYV